MSETQCTEQLELFEVGRQQITMTFDGEQVVSDAGEHFTASRTSPALSLIDDPIRCTILMQLGTESGTQFVKKRYKTFVETERPGRRD